MKTRLLHQLLVLGALVLLVTGLGASEANAGRYPVMNPDCDEWITTTAAYEEAPKAFLNPSIADFLTIAREGNFATSMDLLGEIDYDPAQRNQGGCGNCWVWAATGVMEIAHNVQDSVDERLSIQFLDSCKTDSYACCGGNLGGFVSWYNGQGFVIPWANTDANFVDGATGCGAGASGRACGGISTTPQFPLDSLGEVTISTYGQGQATAIANIKNILNQNRGVFYGFSLPDSASWGDFFDFWDGVGGETEASLWNPDAYCGTEWNENPGQAGGHAVLILGYNDDDADPANHYWLVLNSWGTAAGGLRPNGLFRLPMQLNYDCVFPDTTEDADPDVDRNILANGFWTLDVEFGNAPPTADANGPYSEECQGATTSLTLDGTGSVDPENFPLAYSWMSPCPGAAFDDATAPAPQLTVDSVACSVDCSTTLTVTDDGALSDSDTTSVGITDTTAPFATCPSEATVECTDSTMPANTGSATAVDVCDPTVGISYSDVTTAGSCPAQYTIDRTWTAGDSCGNTTSCYQTINVVDTQAPAISCPAPVTIECDESTDPSNTGMATASDGCDASPVITYTDVATFGACDEEQTITRTWSATDNCGNVSSCVQVVDVVDTTAPVIACNSPATIIPPDAPVSFTASVDDNCDADPTVEVTAYECFFFNGSGKRVNKEESCVVSFSGSTLEVLDSGGVGDNIRWTVRSSDCVGNERIQECGLEVLRP